jgi:perosamine synthetase
MNKYIPYAQQWITKDDIDAVNAVLHSDYLTTGPVVDAFEKKLSEYVNATYAVSFSSGTAALHAAAFTAGITYTAEAIVTPMTFAASANCILYNKGIPVFADIDRQTYNIDHNEIKKRITEKTKAIIPVDFTGQPCDMDEINRIAKDNDLVVIEDACHALGATYKQKMIGSLSDMTIFSFHPVKHITTGEGGAVTTNSEEYYHTLKEFRNHGITRDSKRFQTSSEHGSWYYEQQNLGYNYRLSDVHCALGLSQLEHIDEFISRRKEIVKQYNDAFNDIKGIILPYQADYADSSWHLYVIQLDLENLKVDRNTIFEELKKRNIGVNVHYIPVYLHPYYQQLGYEKGLCPNAEWLYERIITLPLYPKMTDDDVNTVIKVVKKVISYYQK